MLARSLRPGLLVVLALGPASAGCAGSQSDVTADRARYPISLSGVLVDADDRPVYVGEDLVVVAPLEGSTTAIGFVYALTGIDTDISDVVNAEVEKAGGEGVTNLTVTSEQCVLNYMFPMTLLPIWPGCLNIAIKGNVVKRKATGGQAAPAAAAALNAAPAGGAP